MTRIRILILLSVAALISAHPVCGQPTFSVATYNASPNSADNYDALRTCIAAAVAYVKTTAQAATIEFAAGATYAVMPPFTDVCPDGTPLFLIDESGASPPLAPIVVNGNGATLVIKSGHSRDGRDFSGIGIQYATNVTINNLYVDYDPVSFVQGLITGYDASAGTFTLAINGAFASMDLTWINKWAHALQPYGGCSSSAYNLNNPRDTSENIYLAQPSTLGISPVQASSPYPDLTAMGVVLGGDQFVFKAEHFLWVAAVLVYRSHTVTLNDVTVWTSPGAAFNSELVTDLTYERCRVVPKSGYLLSSSRDGFFNNDVTNLVVKDCVVERNGDDGIVTTCIPLTIQSIDAQGNPTVLPYTDGWFANAGDTIDAYETSQLTLRGTSTIQSIGSATYPGSGTPTGSVLHLSSPIPNLTTRDVIYSRAFASGFKIIGCTVLHNRGHGIIGRYDNGTIENNRVIGSTFQGIYVGCSDLGTTDGVGKPVRNVTIAGNHVEHVGYTIHMWGNYNPELGAISVTPKMSGTAAGSTQLQWPQAPTLQGVNVLDNDIADPGLYGVFLGSVNGNAASGTGMLARNRFSGGQGHPYSGQTTDGPGWRLGITYSQAADARIHVIGSGNSTTPLQIASNVDYSLATPDAPPVQLLYTSSTPAGRLVVEPTPASVIAHLSFAVFGALSTGFEPSVWPTASPYWPLDGTTTYTENGGYSASRNVELWYNGGTIHSQSLRVTAGTGTPWPEVCFFASQPTAIEFTEATNIVCDPLTVYQHPSWVYTCFVETAAVDPYNPHQIPDDSATWTEQARFTNRLGSMWTTGMTDFQRRLIALTTENCGETCIRVRRECAGNWPYLYIDNVRVRTQ